MNAAEPEMRTYGEAIEMLRRRGVRLKWARAGGVVIVGALLLGGEVRLAGLAALVLGAAMLLVRVPLSASRFFVAEKFILRDEQGSVRAILCMDEEFSTLRFFAKSGQTVLDLSASSDYSSILLRPETGEESAHLAFETKGGPMLTLTSMFGKAIMGALRLPGAERLSTEWAPGPFISMQDASGGSRAFLSIVTGDLGGTSFGLADGTGKAEVSLNVTEGGTHVEIREQGGFRTLLGRSRADALQGIVLFDKDGGVIWRAP